MRNLILTLAGVVFVSLAAAAIFLALKTPEDAPLSPAAVNIAGADIGGAFTLTDHTGARVSSAELIDGPALIYFGYTFCPDICPVDVAVMASAVDLLDAQGFAVTPVFITIDPARDTPEALAYYAEAMHPRMVALTGTEAEIKAAADAFKVYFQRVDLADSAAGYLMNHSTFTYFMMPDGIRGLFRNGFPPEEMACEVARVLSDYSSSDHAAAAVCFETVLTQSDDYLQYKQQFLIAAQTLISSGQCEKNDFRENGGWVKSTNHGSRPIYFTYCGGLTTENRLYLNVESGEVSR